jgi:CheY-like chemotaxis protein
MLAMLLEDDQHSRDVLARLLNKIGYSKVISAASIEEARYHFAEKGLEIRLIISSAGKVGPDLPLARMAIQNPDLDLCPFVLMTDHWRPRNLRIHRQRMSRVDAVLSRPFGMKKLQHAIAEGHYRRAFFRSTLLLVGIDHEGRLNNAIFEDGDRFHWKKLVTVKNTAELITRVSELKTQLGGILIDPDALEPRMNDWLSAFKRSHMGSITPLVVMSRDPAKIVSLRLIGDLFCDDFQHPSSSERIKPMLSILSSRLLHHWEMCSQLNEIKHCLKIKQPKRARKLLRNSFNLDPARWELLELAGKHAIQTGNHDAAKRFFTKSIEGNPCSPLGYLNIFPFLSPPEKQKWISGAQLYCPRHPQILSYAKRESV